LALLKIAERNTRYDCINYSPQLVPRQIPSRASAMTSDDMQIDILMKEYASMKEEAMFHFRNAKLHLKHFQALVAAVLVIAWYTLFVADSARLNAVVKVIGITNSDLILYTVFALDFISYYFSFDILDSYFCMFLAGARLANIEEQINATWGRRLMIWESKFQSQPVSIFGASRITITAYQILLVFIVSLCAPLYCYWRLRGSNDLSYPCILYFAVAFGVLAFCWFSYAFFAIFAETVKKARNVMNKIVSGEIK
jgi:hypothetical protein